MNLRKGSWLSTVVIAVFLTAHLLPFEIYWATSIFLGTPYVRPGSSEPLVRGLLIAFFVTELIAIGTISYIIDHLITRRLQRRWLQLHLSTCVVLMITASLLIFLHLEVVRMRIGFYTIDYLPVHFLFANYTMLCVGFVAEALARRRNISSDEKLPPAGSEPASDSPRRWVAALPIMTLTLMILLSPLLIDPAMAVCQRHFPNSDLPLLLRVLFDNRRHPTAVILSLLAAIALYFFWVAKDRRRIQWFHFFAAMILLIGLPMVLLILVAPFLPIEGRHK